MGKIMMNDIPYASTYDNSTSVKYSNAKSQLNARNVQDAIDEVVVDLKEHNNPNLLINGDFQVWQRGTEFQTEIANAFKYRGPDRWCTYTPTVSRTVSKVDNGVYTDTNLIQMLEKRLEEGKPYVLSACVDGEIRVLNVIGGIDIIGNGLRYYKFWNDEKYDRIEVDIEDSNGDFHTINWVKLEQGSIATPFVPRLYAEELALCKRYYKKYTVIDNVVYAGQSGHLYIPIPQMSNMRSQKSVLYNNGRVIITTKDGVVDAYTDYAIGFVGETDSEIFIRPSNPKYTAQALLVELTEVVPIIIDAEIY